MGQKQRKHPRQAVSNCKSKKGFFSQCCVFGIKKVPYFSIVKGLTLNCPIVLHHTVASQAKEYENSSSGSMGSSSKTWSSNFWAQQQVLKQEKSDLSLKIQTRR
jgi:hypothetical protein